MYHISQTNSLQSSPGVFRPCLWPLTAPGYLGEKVAKPIISLLMPVPHNSSWNCNIYFSGAWHRSSPQEDHHRAVAAVIRGLPPDWKRPLGRPSHTWLRAVEADLCQQNTGLFVTIAGALWTQQRSSGVCYKRRRRCMTEHMRKVIFFCTAQLKWNLHDKQWPSSSCSTLEYFLSQSRPDNCLCHWNSGPQKAGRPYSLHRQHSCPELSVTGETTPEQYDNKIVDGPFKVT